MLFKTTESVLDREGGGGVLSLVAERSGSCDGGMFGTDLKDLKDVEHPRE